MAADPRGDLGLADLLLLREALGDEGLRWAAEMAGFVRAPEPPRSPAEDQSPPPRPRPPTDRHPDKDAEPRGREPPPREAVSGLRFYRVVGRRPLDAAQSSGEPPAWFRAARSIPPDRSGRVRRVPVPEPLLPWRRTWPFLRAVLGELAEQRAPDLPRLVELGARGKVPRRIPRRTFRSHRPKVPGFFSRPYRHGDAWVKQLAGTCKACRKAS